MQVLLIFFTLFVTTISDGCCSRLDKFKNDIKYSCPLPEEIPKCRCNHQLGGSSIICRPITSDFEFQSILKTLREYSLKYFKISHYNASSISTDVWKGQKIEELELLDWEVNDRSFSRKGKRHFQGLEESLYELTITGSFKTAHRPLLSLQLDHLKKLKAATFQFNNIPEIGNDWFTSGPKELSELRFFDNGIFELGSEAFASLSNLKLLMVSTRKRSYNHINKVSRSMLPKPATLLHCLGLHNNRISTLPSDMFSEMPALEILLLTNNLIHMIEEDTWKSVATKIDVLSIGGNPLKCDEKMKWICNTILLKRAEGTKCSSPLVKEGRTTLQHFCGNH